MNEQLKHLPVDTFFSKIVLLSNRIFKVFFFFGSEITAKSVERGEKISKCVSNSRKSVEYIETHFTFFTAD